jgi:hypothetical protein
MNYKRLICISEIAFLVVGCICVAWIIRAVHRADVEVNKLDVFLTLCFGYLVLMNFMFGLLGGILSGVPLDNMNKGPGPPAY